MTRISAAFLFFYFGGILLLGIAAHRRSRQTSEDYFLASRGIGLWLLVGTVAATLVNGLAVTGTPALFYQGGILFGQMFVAVGGCVALMWFYGPRVCQLSGSRGFITPGELFADHYHSRTVLVLTAGFGMLSIFPFLAIQLAGIGKVLSATSGGAIAQPTAVALCAGSVGVYLFLGGARASVWTDAVQGLIALVVFVVSAALFSSWVGGVPESIDKLQQLMPEKLVFNTVNTPLFIDNILSWTFAFFLWPHVFQRMFMARSPRAVRQMAGALMLVFPLALMSLLIMAMTATAELYGSLNDPDQLIATMFHRHFPIGGIFLTLLIFALAMSTIDSMLLALGSSATRDVWEGLLQKASPSQSGFALSRWITMAFLMFASLFALTAIGRGAITPWVTLGASIATLNLWPFLGVFVWRRASVYSVITAMCLGFLAICITRFTAVGEMLPFGFATAGFVVSATSFLIVEIIVSLASSRDAR